MSWFHERMDVPSEKAGRLEVQRSLGRWEVVVRGTGASTRYLTAMWIDALARVPDWMHVKSVLMLGLGIGDNLAPIRRRFPGSRVTAVEWDPAMVELFHRIGPKDGQPPEIVVGDAWDAVQELSGPYDLILIDLFTGPEIGAPVRRPEFHARLAELLKPTGILLANFYLDRGLVAMLEPHFSGIDAWTWSSNRLAMAQPKLPAGYVPYRGDPAYLLRECAPGTGGTAVGDPPTGMRWGFGPFRFELHEGDVEPGGLKDGPWRTVHWQRLQRRDVPRGWRTSRFSRPMRLTGFTDLDRVTEADWTPHARRHLAKWRKQDGFTIREVGLEDFIREYRRSRLRRSLTFIFATSMRLQAKRHGGRLKCHGVFRSDGALRGGFVSLEFPESRGALHVASFVHEDAERASAMYGLVERWFATSRAAGLRFMEFDGFWSPGEPNDRKGYSRFKSQFGVTFVRRPEPLVRQAGRWFTW